MSEINIQKERLKAYIDAETKTLRSQEYQEGSKRNKRANLSDIHAGINNLLASGAGTEYTPGSRSRRVIFRD